MNQIVYLNRCKCKEEEEEKKKKKEQEEVLIPTKKRSEGRPLKYPSSQFYENLDEPLVKTFEIKYEKKLSSTAKSILNSFRHKYFYYAIDDILYLLKSNPIERDNLLAIIYSPVLSLQNNLSINFFDVWIDEIYINEISKVNKFLTDDFQNLEQFNYITMKLFYQTRIPDQKPEPLW